MTIVQVYLLFAKYGLLCFGGGYMLVPLITAELVGPGKPLTSQEFSSLFSIAQVTPGPIGINTATYVGFTQQGVIGSILATAGIITPAIIMVILASTFLNKYKEHFLVRGFLAGMKPAVFGLILSAAVIFAEMSIFSADIPWCRIWQKLIGDAVNFQGFHLRIIPLLIAAATTVLMLKTRISFMYLLLISALLGALFCR